MFDVYSPINPNVKRSRVVRCIKYPNLIQRGDIWLSQVEFYSSIDECISATVGVVAYTPFSTFEYPRSESRHRLQIRKPGVKDVPIHFEAGHKESLLDFQSFGRNLVAAISRAHYGTVDTLTLPGSY